MIAYVLEFYSPYKVEKLRSLNAKIHNTNTTCEISRTQKKNKKKHNYRCFSEEIHMEK